MKSQNKDNTDKKDDNIENENNKNKKNLLIPKGSCIISSKKNENIILSHEDLYLISPDRKNIQILLKDCENINLSMYVCVYVGE